MFHFLKSFTTCWYFKKDVFHESFKKLHVYMCIYGIAKMPVTLVQTGCLWMHNHGFKILSSLFYDSLESTFCCIVTDLDRIIYLRVLSLIGWYSQPCLSNLFVVFSFSSFFHV